MASSVFNPRNNLHERKSEVVTYHEIEEIAQIGQILRELIDAVAPIPQLGQIQLVDLFRALVPTLGVQIPDIVIAKVRRDRIDTARVRLMVKYTGYQADIYGPWRTLQDAMSHAEGFSAIIQKARESADVQDGGSKESTSSK